ncbi:hypothetical protein [Streptomyces sp. NPDC048266]|uniref:hypothetical protein n=1 Tax=Streptomyces sp. NPDC048266 TaxID=3155787 RepID=UPI0033EA7097
MEFELTPPTGLGALVIGMPREAADQALASFRDPSAISESDQLGRFVFRPSGLMVSINCSRGKLEAIELGRPASGQDIVRFRGIDVFGLPAAEVVTQLRGLTTITEAEDDRPPSSHQTFFSASGAPSKRTTNPTKNRATTSARSSWLAPATTTHRLKLLPDSAQLETRSDDLTELDW